jgi:DNA modification methylase
MAGTLGNSQPGFLPGMSLPPGPKRLIRLPKDACKSSIIENISKLNANYEIAYSSAFTVEKTLNRQLVSFQANKCQPRYRWYKYKEGFSAGIVEYLFDRYNVHKGVILDPFAGSGTALFVASGKGIDAEGIELLPIGQRIIEANKLAAADNIAELCSRLRFWIDNSPWNSSPLGNPLPELRITSSAYPKETEYSVRRYLSAIEHESNTVRPMLFFALLCILEVISYTRKDGQYLRWDYRSGRKQGKKIFVKGNIQPFDSAIINKLKEIVSDISAAGSRDKLFSQVRCNGLVTAHHDSALNVMPNFSGNYYDCIITSPPYCNRYDYTRTYALELALIGINEPALVQLRQDMLSCTVENREKDLLSLNPNWAGAVEAADRMPLLQEILSYLDQSRQDGLLNNNGIPRMVRGYFYEMACIIYECARVLKKGAPMIMVNDNVRYAGVSVSVDIILSEIAQSLGFRVENILVLPNGKGNSSQQMGKHGRDALRKCVYVWKKE